MKKKGIKFIQVFYLSFTDLHNILRCCVLDFFLKVKVVSEVFFDFIKY